MSQTLRRRLVCRSALTLSGISDTLSRVQPKAAVEAVLAYLRAHPEELVRAIRSSLGLRVGIPLASLRWLSSQAGAAMRETVIESVPPGLHIATTVDLMDTPVRVSTDLFVERLTASEEELRVELRLEGLAMQVLSDEASPVAALIRSGALDLSRSGSLVSELPELRNLLGESEGNRVVLDLMKHPNLAKNRALRRVLGVLTAFMTVHAIETDGTHLDIVFRALPHGARGLARAMREHVFTDGPAWVRGVLTGRPAVHERPTA